MGAAEVIRDQGRGIVPAADERRAQVLCPPGATGTTLTVAAAVPT